MPATVIRAWRGRRHLLHYVPPLNAIAHGSPTKPRRRRCPLAPLKKHSAHAVSPLQTIGLHDFLLSVWCIGFCSIGLGRHPVEAARSGMSGRVGCVGQKARGDEIDRTRSRCCPHDPEVARAFVPVSVSGVMCDAVNASEKRGRMELMWWMPCRLVRP